MTESTEAINRELYRRGIRLALAYGIGVFGVIALQFRWEWPNANSIWLARLGLAILAAAVVWWVERLSPLRVTSDELSPTGPLWRVVLTRFVMLFAAPLYLLGNFPLSPDRMLPKAIQLVIFAAPLTYVLSRFGPLLISIQFEWKFAPIFFAHWSYVGCCFIYVLSPIPTPAADTPRIIPKGSIAGPVYIACFLLAPILMYYSWLGDEFWDLVSTRSANSIISSSTGNLDDIVRDHVTRTNQSTFWVLGIVAFGRWLTARQRIRAYIAFVFSMLVLILIPLVLIYNGFSLIMLWVESIGINLEVGLHVLWALLAFATIMAFIGWALYPPRPEERSR